MVPNPSKTKCMLITTRQKHQLHPPPLNLTLQSQNIEQVKTHRLLGVIIDDQMSWAPHIDAATKTVSKSTFLLSKLKYFTDVHTRKLFYSSHIQPHLNYASCVWDGCSEASLKRLNSLHRRAAKLILAESPLNTDEKLVKLNFLPLRKRFLFNKGVLMRKAMVSGKPPYLANLFELSSTPHNTRSEQKTLKIVKPRLDLYKTSFSFSGAKLWNSLPDFITSAPSMCSFKTQLQKHLFNS